MTQFPQPPAWPPPRQQQVMPYRGPHEQRPAAPKVLGIIGIVFASIAILNHGIGLLLLPMVRQRAIDMGLTGIVTWWPIVDSCVSLALALLLMFSAISLVRWLPTSRKRMLAWAALHLGWLVVHGIVQFGFLTRPTLEARLAAAGQTGQMQAAMVGAYVAGFITLVLIAAYPLIVLILLNQPRVKQALEGGEASP